MTGFEIAALVMAIGGLYAGYQGQRAMNTAQEDARKLENRKAQLENARRARRAVAERRMIQAELIQGTETMGARTSSAMSGAVGSLSTQTAANIGAANTQLAGDIGIGTALTRGARAQARWDTAGAIFNVGSQMAAFGAQNQQMQQQQNAFEEQLKRQQAAWSSLLNPNQSLVP